jgi:glycosyltransferase involved in cell wall biosynthesis
VDIDQWPPRPPRRRVSGEIARLVHVASLNPVKDQRTLLQALTMLATTGVPFTLDIVGEDTLGGQLQTLAGILGIAPRVAFHGFLSQQKLRAVVENADLLVMASRHEAGPLALLEAAVVGVPAVGTAVGHFAEWAPHAAVAVPVGDAAALAAAINRVLGDEALRMRLASAAQALALRSDANYTAAKFQAIHERLLQAN